MSTQHNLRVNDFRLLRLTLIDVGPFREYYEIDFTNGNTSSPIVDAELDSSPNEPSNLFLLLGKNGFGKTTVLEVIALLLKHVGQSGTESFGHYDLDEGHARVQADFRGNWSMDDSHSTVLLSIWAGSDGPLSAWTPTELETVAQATEWAGIGLVRSPLSATVELGPGTNELGRLFAEAVRQAVGTPPPALFGEGLNLPTVLLFPADRSLRRPPTDERAVARPTYWGYKPSLRFETDGSTWANSMDNLLVWLSWLGDGRDERLRSYVHEKVFMDGGKTLMQVNRERLSTSVETPTGLHPLYNLSHGERQLLQLLVRAAAHMTTSTIILIDELEMHLHPKWRVSLLKTLKQLVKDFDGLSIIFTTHERELIGVFNHEVPEEGLVKAGFLLEQGL